MYNNGVEDAMIDLNSEFGHKVENMLNIEQVIWFITTGADLTPQPRPVWFVWDGSSFLIFSQAQAHKVRHVSVHPRVALNFNTDETGDGTVISFSGSARIDLETPPAHENPGYMKKYGQGIKALKMTPQQFSQEYCVAIRVEPDGLRGW